MFLIPTSHCTLSSSVYSSHSIYILIAAIVPDENGGMVTKFKALIQNHNHDHTPLVVTMRRYKVHKKTFEEQDDDSSTDSSDADVEDEVEVVHQIEDMDLQEERLKFKFGAGSLGIGIFVGKEDQRIHVTKVTGQVFEIYIRREGIEHSFQQSCLAFYSLSHHNPTPFDYSCAFRHFVIPRYFYDIFEFFNCY